MNLAQNVCLDDFKVMYIFLSSDFLKFFRLGQFLSDHWSYRVIFGTWEVFVFRSVTIAPTATQPVILSTCKHLSMAS